MATHIVPSDQVHLIIFQALEPKCALDNFLFMDSYLISDLSFFPICLAWHLSQDLPGGVLFLRPELNILATWE